jgi:hypothetical protein
MTDTGTGQTISPCGVWGGPSLILPTDNVSDHYHLLPGLGECNTI